MAEVILLIRDELRFELCARIEGLHTPGALTSKMHSTFQAQNNILPREGAGSLRTPRAEGMERPGGGLASGSCVLNPASPASCSKPPGPWRVLPESLSHARVPFSRIISPTEHSPPCIRAIFKAQIRSDLHTLKLSCSFPAALRMKSSILGWPHEALLHSAPATTSSAPAQAGAPSVWGTSCQPRRVPQRHLPAPLHRTATATVRHVSLVQSSFLTLISV